MARRETKFDWPLVQFLSERVGWPFEFRAKSENGKLKMGGQRQRLPTLRERREDWGTRKLNGERPGNPPPEYGLDIIMYYMPYYSSDLGR